jgi:N-acetyltransferase
VALLDDFDGRGRWVSLEPLAVGHVAGLAEAAAIDRSTYRWTTVPEGPESMGRYLDDLLAHKAAGSALPFAQRRVADGALVGCTRFFVHDHWKGRADPDEVEIGGTWLAPDAQRTPINTEAKLLLLTHAFDIWACERVCLCTDARNERSRVAIERIGARFEGVLRSHRASHVAGEEGRARDSAMFAVTAGDWPGVRSGLRARLGL